MLKVNNENISVKVRFSASDDTKCTEKKFNFDFLAHNLLGNKCLTILLQFSLLLYYQPFPMHMCILYGTINVW